MNLILGRERKRILFITWGFMLLINCSYSDSMLALNVTNLTQVTSSYAGYYEVRGYEFSTSSSFYTVNYLGLYDYYETGFSNAHDVGIWAVGGNFIASVIVPSGVQAPLYKGFRWVKLSDPVTLEPHSAYVMAAYDMPATVGGTTRKVVQISEIASSDNLTLGSTLRFSLSTNPISFSYPSITVADRSNIGFGPNMAGSLQPFDGYKNTNTQIAANFVSEDGRMSILLSNASPFLLYSIECSSNLLSSTWNKVGNLKWNADQPDIHISQLNTSNSFNIFRIQQSDYQ